MKSPRCKRGHLWSENTLWIVVGLERKYRQCRACKRALQKLRYRNDPTYHAREKERARQRYYRAREREAGHAGHGESVGGGG